MTDSAGEPQEFFATQKVIDRSNQRLRQAGSNVTLAIDNTVTVTVANGRPLFKVVPHFRTGNPPPAVCRDSAAAVLGGDPDRIVLRNNDLIESVLINSNHPDEVTGTHHLAMGLVDVVDDAMYRSVPVYINPEWAADQIRSDSRRSAGIGDAPSPGDRYGSAQRPTMGNRTRRLLLNEASRQVGVNEHAWAQVGEGYCSSSIKSIGRDGSRGLTDNFARRGNERVPFGYHFAAVVAESEDGETQITFENYNRAGHVTRALNDVLEHNLAAFGEHFSRAEAEAKASGDERKVRLVCALRELHNAQTNGNEQEIVRADFQARDALMAVSGVPDANSLWHFKAYSRRSGESFHELNINLFPDQSQQPLFNLLTFVVLGGHGNRDYHAVRFDRKQRDTVSANQHDGMWRWARYVSKQAVWWDNQNQSPPEITVTGYGNAWSASSAKQTGSDRAAVAAREMRPHIVAHLDQLQSNLQSLIITERSGGRNVPPDIGGPNVNLSREEARRQVIFRVQRGDQSGYGGKPAVGEGTSLDTERPKVNYPSDVDTRYSRDVTTEWMTPDRPMHRDQWESVRANAAVTRVSGELILVKDSSTITVDADGRQRFETNSVHLPFGFAIRRMEVEQGRWVLEATANVHLDVPRGMSPSDVGSLKNRAKRGADRWFNQGYRLASGDQFHVRVEFVDDSQDAHRSIKIGLGSERSTADVWALDADSAKIAHEIGHGVFGLHDAYTQQRVIFQNTLDGDAHPGTSQDVRNRVVHESGLMSRWYSPDGELRPRELWMIGQNLVGGPVIQDTPYTQLHGDRKVGQSLFSKAQNGDRNARIRLAHEGHRESLAALTELATDGDTDAVRALADLATQGDLHAVAALIRARSDVTIGDRNPVQVLVERARPLGSNELAAALLTEAAAKGDTDATRTLIESGSQGDVHALAALIRIGDTTAHPELGDRTPIGALAEHSYDDEAADLLIEFANDGNLTALVALAERGNETARNMMRQLAADGDTDAVVAMVGYRDVTGLAGLAQQGNDLARDGLDMLGGPDATTETEDQTSQTTHGSAVFGSSAEPGGGGYLRAPNKMIKIVELGGLDVDHGVL